MLSTQVGSTAGTLWQTLGKQKRLTLAKLPTALKVEKDLALVALGWLAREEKVKIVESGKNTTVSLTESEQAIYNKARTQSAPKVAEKTAEAGA